MSRLFDAHTGKQISPKLIARTTTWLVLAAVCALLLIAAPALVPPLRGDQDPCSLPPQPGCFVRPSRDIALMVDASGSIEDRGQTYNSAIEGIIRAVNDPTSIPRDGSVAICVVVFNGAATIGVPLTDINSESDASKVASTLQTLKCSSIHTLIFPCPFGQTLYTAAIKAADAHVNKARQANPKPNTGRAFVMISDGQPEDPDFGVEAFTEARNASATLGIPFESDAILIGLDTSSEEFQTSKATIDQIVFPAPTSDLPGATFAINTGDCSLEGATFGSDCSRQSNELAELIRKIVFQPLATKSLTVTTENDTDPGSTPAPGQLSLRQAIEMANCNGGGAAIGFASGINGKTISLTSALPPIASPDVVINGCADSACAPGITIDGGGKFADGLSVRSNRDTVRGLHIINFTRSGIAIQPLCPNDTVGHNIIELNVLDNNPIGVLVGQLPDQSASVNVRNTISRNAFSRGAPAADAPPAALIDLSADGPTANDAGDGDQGPNTLLNFPDFMECATGANNTVDVSGVLLTPPSDGATVQIYGVTSFRTVSTNVVIDGASYLATTKADATGKFTATGVTPSTTGIYTALVIDDLKSDNPADGSANTSELMSDSPSTPLPKSMASVTTSVAFGDSPINTPQTKPVDISNGGTAPLIIKSCSIGRCPGANSDNRDRFSVTGCPAGPIDPGQKVTINVIFNANACGPAAACLILATNDPFNPLIFVSLTGNGTAPPHAVVQDGVTSLTFKGQVAQGSPRPNPKTQSFTVNNTGCSGLVIQRATLVRLSGSSSATDDSGTFKVTPQGQSGFPVTIAAQGSVTFVVAFNPVIPAVVQSGSPTVKDILPHAVNDLLTLEAANGERVNIALQGKIKKPFIFIDPRNPANAPVVTLCVSGNEFIVEFSAYDSNLNLSNATYQFQDSSGRPVGAAFSVDLQQAISSKNIAEGQSVTITQHFTGANDNKSVSSVSLTVSDGESGQTVTATAGSCGSSAGASISSTPFGGNRKSRRRQ